MEDVLFRSPYYRVSIKVLIVDQEWKILLIQGEEGKRDLPGWGLDRWEEPIEWLKREIMEETWLQLLAIDERPLYFLTRKEEGKWRSNTIYRAQLKDLAFTASNECIRLDFFTKKEALQLELFPNIPIFLRQYSETDSGL
jgi:ADP-ribose pyrophosphatase YjhB (NUDIX family)